jgi:hypothetical protein
MRVEVTRTAVPEQPFIPDMIHRATNLLFVYPLGGWEDTMCTPRVEGANIRRHCLHSIDWIPTQRAGSTLVQGIHFLHFPVG